TRLLLVDDDPDLRRLFKAQLARAEFEVDLAEDGREGVQLARAREYDLIVADVNMPRLDGWGMLRELRADYRTREIPVIFLSAHDDYRETLQAARCGAWDYLPKTGRADVVIDRAQAALGPRRRAAADLREGLPGEMDMGLLGPRWLLRTLGRQRSTGVLAARDEWASYRIAVRGGAPVLARANAAGRETSGVSAVGAFLVSRGATGEFTPQAVEDPATFDVAMEDLLDATCAALNELEARAASDQIRQAGTVEVDGDLYQLYRRVASDRDLMIARALCEEKLPAQQLAAHLQLPPEIVEAGIADLLRRRVIRFARPGGG
ncbi:MAG TPA: response regulator, partial [Myxococcaceae bacterium]|nr:response regulator [Myxococcaceae bacterium]